MGQVLKELGFLGEAGGGQVHPQWVFACAHTRVQNLNGVAVNNLRRLINHGARRIFAVTRLAVVAAQCAVGGCGVARLFQFAAVDDEFGGELRLHAFHNGFG